MWFLLAAVLPLVAANRVYDEKCPDPAGVAVIDENVWAGNWYVAYKYPNDPVFSGSCPHSLETINGDVIDVSVWFLTDGVQYHNEGTSWMRSDADNTTKFMYSQTTGNTVGEWPVTIIASDYENYAIFYNCIYDETSNTHEDYVWIKSRTPSLEGDAFNAVQAYIKTTNLVDAAKLIKYDFSDSDCSYSSTLDLTN